MDHQYKEAHKRTEQLCHRINDYLDDRTHQHARVLVDSAREIQTNLQIKLNPRTIEDRVKRLIRHLEDMYKTGSAAMTTSDVATLKKEFEELCGDIRQFENY